MLAEYIKAYFWDKVVGDCHRLPGEKESIKFELFAHKEHDYIMILMSTYGACIECQNQQEIVRSWVEKNCTIKEARFFYKEVTSNHYPYWG